jgi:hypothetical protein
MPVVVPSPGAADIYWAQAVSNLLNTLESNLEFAVPTFAYKPSGESATNSTTFQDDDHLFVSVAANARYRMIMHLIVTCTSTTPDLQFRFNAPSGSTFTGSAAGLANGATVVSGELNAGAIAVANSFPTGGFGYASLNGTHGVISVGTLLVGANPGTFQLQWSQQNANAAPLTIGAGSSLEMRRIS